MPTYILPLGMSLGKLLCIWISCCTCLSVEVPVLWSIKEFEEDMILMSCDCASAAKGKCTQLHTLKVLGWEKKKEIRYFSLHVFAAFFKSSKGSQDEDTTRKEILRGRPYITAPWSSENGS